MLTHLKLENFKIWRSTGPVRLAPLTLLLGTNSSGKSSLIQSLLLIRQTVKGDDTGLDLNLGNPDAEDTVTMGQFRDLLCRHGAATESTPANQVGIEFRWAAHSAPAQDSTLFSARYGAGPSGSAELRYLRLGKDGEGFTVLRQKPGIYRLLLAKQKLPVRQSADYRPERSFAFSAATLNKLGPLADGIRPVGPALLDELSRIIYLGPVRQLARRDYVWSGRMPAHIGDDGGRAVDVLIASGVAQQAGRGVDRSDDAGRIFRETERWLRELDVAEGLQVRSLGRSARYELLVRHRDAVVNLKDVGVGVSQVMPVVVAALFANPGHIVIVEEPESHLHPLAQAKLAELMATVSASRGVQFIVETHSEHLFRRMQTLMARQQVQPSQAAMYFVEREGQTAKLRELELDDLGRVANWPDKFFGDSLGETREQTALAIQRAKHLRAKGEHGSN
jgi:ABC-type branched-subunit amino acid transport system ATPase component